jgi:hypothetical protein
MPDINTGRITPGTGVVTLRGTDPVTNTSTTVTTYSSTSGTTTSLTPVGSGGVTDVSGRNLGLGHPVFAGSNGSTHVVLDFKTLIAGAGVSITEASDSLTLAFNPAGQKISFLSLIEAPTRIVPNSFLVGTQDGNLNFIAPPTTAGTYLTFNGVGFAWNPAAKGTVRGVTLNAQDGLYATGDTITDTGSFMVGLTPSGVTPGMYTAATVTVDSFGRVTAAASTPVGEVNTASNVGAGAPVFKQKTDVNFEFKSLLAGGLITLTDTGSELLLSANAVTRVGMTGSNGIVVAGQTISSTGAFDVSLAETGVTPGTYNTLTVDGFGRVIDGQTLPVGEINTAASVGQGASLVATKTGAVLNFKGIQGAGAIQISDTGTDIVVSSTAVTSVAGQGYNGIVVSGGPITSQGTLSVGLSNTGVQAGVYKNVTLTVDATGRLTAVTQGADPEVILGSNIGSGTGEVFVQKTNGILQFRTLKAGANASIVENADTVTIDAVIPPLAVTGANAVANAVAQIAFGPEFAVTSNAGTVSVALAAPEVPALQVSNGNVSQEVATLAIGANLQVSYSGNVATISGTPTGVTSVAITSSDLTVTGSPIVSSGTIDLSLPDTGVQAGTYDLASVTIDSKGRVTAIANGSVAGGSNGTVTSVALDGLNGITVTGSPITNAGLLQVALSNTGVVAGDYSLASFTVDGTGRITAVANGTASVSGSGSAVASLGTGTSLLGANTVSNGVTTYGLKSLVQGTGILLSDSGDSVSIATTATVSSVDATGRNGILVNGGPITTSGTFDIALANTGVVAGDYQSPVLSIDATGRVTAIANGTSTAVASARNESGDGHLYEYTDGSSLVFRALVAGQGVSISETQTQVTIDLPNTGVIAGTYQYAQVTVDAQGRVIGIQAGAAPSGDANGGGFTAENVALGDVQVFRQINASVLEFRSLVAGQNISLSQDAGTITINANVPAASGTVTSVAVQGTSDIVVSGSPVTSSGTIALSLSNTGVVQGTYNTVRVDSHGRVVSASNTAYLTQNQTITLSGDVTGTGANAITVALANTGVAPGTYSLASVTVDAKGRVVGIANGTAQAGGGNGTVTSVGFSASSDFVVTGAPITSSGTIAVSLSNTGVQAGIYRGVTVDSHGRVIAGLNPVLRDSDVILVSNASVTSYPFTINGSALPLDPNFSMVFINRQKLRRAEYSIIDNAVTFAVTLNTDDELEVVTLTNF